MPSDRRFRPSAAVALAALALSVAGCGQSTRAVGDGTLVDQGWGSYFPRYEVRTDALTVRDGEEATFEIGKLPKSDYDFYLALESDHGSPKTPADWNAAWDAFSKSDCRVRVEVGPAGGEGARWEHEAALAGGWTPGGMGPRINGYWTSRLDRLPLEGDIEIAVRIESAESDSTKGYELRLVFAGGGRRI